MTVTRTKLTTKAKGVEEALRRLTAGSKPSKYRRQWPPHSTDELRWWYRHHTPSQIAETYGVAVVTLRAYWRRHGEVPPKKNWRKGFFSRILKTKGCWIWTGANNEEGYGFASGGDGVQTKAHRLSWEIHNKAKIPSGLIVLHSCDNPSCVNPRHLSVGTHSENARDAFAKGRRKALRGEENVTSRLTESQVVAARKLLRTNMPVTEIARSIDAPYAAVWRAMRGETWAWL